VYFLNGKFWATLASPYIYCSTDGATWTELVTTNGIGAYLAGDGVNTMVAVAASGTSSYYTTDNWVNSTLVAQTSVRRIAYGAGLFVIFGSSGHITTSPNGITWTTRTNPGITGTPTGLTYSSKAGFMGVVSSGTSYITSADGITWTLRTLPTAQGFTSPYDPVGDKFGIVCLNNNNQRLYTTTDFSAWTCINLTPPTNQIGTVENLGVNPAGTRPTQIATDNQGKYLIATNGLSELMLTNS
jgi:hypothetical protein